MVEVGNTLYVVDRGAWRDWLTRNHAVEPEIWLVYHTKASGQPSLPYNDAVEEALCFGWIDSVVKKQAASSRVQRFTPRRPGSPLSEMNKERMRRLRADGRLTAAGLAAAGDTLDEPFEIAPDILEALQANQEIWANFLAFPEGYQRIRVGFIEASRRRRQVF